MTDTHILGPWIRRFLMEYLVGERNFTRSTQTSYRDTLVLLLPFVAGKVKKPIDRLTIEHLSSTVTRLFLTHLEEERSCSVATRNQRLSAHPRPRPVHWRTQSGTYHMVWRDQDYPFQENCKAHDPLSR